MSNYTWSPTTGYIDNANVTRLARKHGLHGIDELRRRSVADPGWYWNAVLEDLGIEFSTPHSAPGLDERGAGPEPRHRAPGLVRRR